MFGLGMRLPRKLRDKTKTLHACVWRVLCECLMNGVYTMLCIVYVMCA